MADIIIDSDSGKFKAGDDLDLEIYNNGSHSYISNATASQSIVLRTRASGGATADAVTIDADKNVTIEGNLTVNKAITFNETSVDADFRVESADNQYMLFVDGGNNRVAIGTGTPDHHLEITTDSADTTVAISAHDNTNATVPKLIFKKSAGSEGVPGIVADGEALGKIEWYGYNTNGSTYDLGGYMHMKVDAAVGSSTDMPTQWILALSPNDAAVPTTRINMLSSGAMYFYQSDGSTSQLSLDGSGNSTFAGDVNIATAGSTSSGILTVQCQTANAGDGTAMILRNYSASPYTGYVTTEYQAGTITIAETSAYRTDSNNGSLIFRTKQSGTMDDVLTLNNSGTATFAGEITTTSTGLNMVNASQVNLRFDTDDTSAIVTRNAAGSTINGAIFTAGQTTSANMDFHVNYTGGSSGNNYNRVLRLSADKSATFAGITTVHKAGANSELIVKSDSSTYWTSLVLNTNSSTNNYIVSDSSIVHFNSARTSTGASLSIDNANDRVGINEPSPAYNLEITEGTFAQTKSNNGHVSEYLGNFGVANGNKLIILINHPSGGYHHIQGTIKVVGACGGHAAARVSLIRHFLITSLSGYDETTSDVVQYDDVHSNVASGVTISALDNSDNISGGAGGTDDFEMSITNSTGHTNDNASYEVYYELFGQITGFTVSASV